MCNFYTAIRSLKRTFYYVNKSYNPAKTDILQTMRNNECSVQLMAKADEMLRFMPPAYNLVCDPATYQPMCRKLNNVSKPSHHAVENVFNSDSGLHDAHMLAKKFVAENSMQQVMNELKIFLDYYYHNAQRFKSSSAAQHGLG